MSWFKSDPEPEEVSPEPVRLASDEFLSGLVEIQNIYASRAKRERTQVIVIATDLTEKQYFNFGEIDRAADEIRDAMKRARHLDGSAAEVGDWINSYKYRGRRPPYMPPLPDNPQTKG